MKQGMKWTVLLLIVLITIIPVNAQASTNDFYVRAVLPDNQIDKRQSYFDLHMEPSDQQTIKLMISNPSGKKIKVYTTLTSADTGRNGLIIYESSDEYDDSLEYPITDIAKVRQPEITLPPDEFTHIDIDLEMPRDAVEGVILGGLVVKAEVEGEKEQEASGVGLTNKFAYVVGLKLTQGMADIEPDFDIIQILPGLVNYHTAVTFKLQNKKPLIVTDMSVSADVYRKGSDQVLRSLKLENREMAPNSNGSFVIDWEDQKLKVGTYRLKARVDYEGQAWEWDEEFEVLPDDAAQINDEAVYIEKNNTWIWMILGVILMLILLTGAYFLGKGRKGV